MTLNCKIDIHLSIVTQTTFVLFLLGFDFLVVRVTIDEDEQWAGDSGSDNNDAQEVMSLASLGKKKRVCKNVIFFIFQITFF